MVSNISSNGWVPILFSFFVLFFLSGCTKNIIGSSKLPVQSSAYCNLKYTKSAPPEMYQAMVSCINEKSYDDAVYLFSLTGVYSWYDAERINSHYARNQHNLLLDNALVNVRADNLEKFWLKVKGTLQVNSKSHVKICQKIFNLGVPTYSPVYMYEKKQKYVDSISQPELLKKALESYLHC